MNEKREEEEEGKRIMLSNPQFPLATGLTLP
jgi:hypothetical protein